MAIMSSLAQGGELPLLITNSTLTVCIIENSLGCPSTWPRFELFIVLAAEYFVSLPISTSLVLHHFYPTPVLPLLSELGPDPPVQSTWLLS